MAFVTVKFNSNQSLLFNPNCKTKVLLDDIKKRCQCNDDAKLEVSDTKGEVKYLQEHLEDYATSLLKGREILILLEIKKNEETNESKYVPLLRNVRKLYPDAYERLSKAKSNNADNKDGTEDNSKNLSKPASKTRQTTQSGQQNNSNNQNSSFPVTKGSRRTNEEHKRRSRVASTRF